MDATAPGYEVQNSTPYFFDVARDPVLQLMSSHENSVFKCWRDAKAGIPAIPEGNHATKNCGCLELSMGNNFESKMYWKICLPKEYAHSSRSGGAYSDTLESLNNAAPRLSLIHI